MNEKLKKIGEQMGALVEKVLELQDKRVSRSYISAHGLGKADFIKFDKVVTQLDRVEKRCKMYSIDLESDIEELKILINSFDECRINYEDYKTAFVAGFMKSLKERNNN